MKKPYSVIGCIVISASLQIVANAQVTDIEGNTYKTVQIGSQLWMAENLRATKYNDGTPIPLVQGPEWYNMNTHGYCWYNNNFKSFGNIYGPLYNWYAVAGGNLCPSGWHVPSNTDWANLYNHLGSEKSAGGRLKETGTLHWKSPNTGATDSNGFTALPGGGRWVAGYFDLIGRRCYCWSTSPFDDDFDATVWMIPYDEIFIKRVPTIKGNGFSVRCVKD